MKIRIGKHYQLNVVKFIRFIVVIVCVLFLLWFAISYCDVLWHQCNGGTSHVWNAFNIIERLGAE